MHSVCSTQPACKLSSLLQCSMPILPNGDREGGRDRVRLTCRLGSSHAAMATNGCRGAAATQTENAASHRRPGCACRWVAASYVQPHPATGAKICRTPCGRMHSAGTWGDPTGQHNQSTGGKYMVGLQRMCAGTPHLGSGSAGCVLCKLRTSAWDGAYRSARPFAPQREHAKALCQMRHWRLAHPSGSGRGTPWPPLHLRSPPNPN